MMVRPRGKTPHEDLRRTLEAIIWRHRNGATWRAVPAELGEWYNAAQTFIRWGKQGVWERLLALAQERAGGAELGMAFLDGTNVRAHAKAAGAPKKGGTGPERDAREALGRSRGGFGTKVTAVADSRGRAVAFHLAPGPGARTAERACVAGQAAGRTSLGGRRQRLTRPMPCAPMSGTSAPGPRCPPKATKPPCAAPTSSTATATASSACGAGSRNGVPSPHDTRKQPRPSQAFSASLRPWIGSSANKP